MSTPLSSGHLQALYDILDFLAGIRDNEEDKVWARLLEKLAVAIDAEEGTYWSYLASKRQLLPRYVLGEAGADMRGTPVDIRTGICGWVATHREPALVEDAYKDKRFLEEVDRVTGFKTTCVLAVPLLDRMDLSGVLQLLNKRHGRFDDADLRLVAAACRAAAMTLRSLRNEAMVDKVSAKHNAILENLGGGFMAVDTHGRIIICNPAARRILDLPPDMPLNVPAEQALERVPQLAEVLVETLASKKTVRRQELEWTIHGERRILGYSTILIQDPNGELSGAGVSFQDITSVKR